MSSSPFAKCFLSKYPGSVVAEIAVNEGFIASALDRTGLWNVSENKVETTIESSLDLQLLRKNAAVITEHLSKMCGRKMEFIVAEKQPEVQAEQTESKEVPVQVEVLLNAFKGTVVTGN